MNLIAEKIIRPVLDIRPGERMKTGLMFIYFLLVISTIYILKPVRSALFIDDFGADKMKYINVAEGFFLIAVAAVYSWLAKKLPHRLFDMVMSLFLISNLILFWLLAGGKSPWLSAFFFVWQSSFSVILTTQFWIFANDLFSAAEAKRLFGIIISGGSVGGILGGWLTQKLTVWMPVQNLFLIVAGILGLCILVTLVLWKQVRHEPPAAEGERQETAEKGNFSGLSYLLLISAVVVLAKMTSTLIENQFAGTVQTFIQGKQALAGFYGGFYAWLNLFSFLLQFFLTGSILRRIGPKGAIWILPAGLAFLSAGSLLSASLALAIIYRMFDGSVNYSIQQASKEILYLPVPSAVRRRAKPWIDMFGFRGAKTLAGLYMIAGTALLHLPAQKMGALVLFLLIFWMIILLSIKNKIKSAPDL